MSLEVRYLNKSYNSINLYRDFSLVFPEGTITCILGPSGCGKTTLLNIIGKITPPDSGKLIAYQESHGETATEAEF